MDTSATEIAVTNNEPLAVDAFDIDRYDEVLRLTGQDSFGGDRSTLAQLRINKDPEDDQGRAVPHGTFTCEVEDIGPVYAKSVSFRPFLRGYQYRRYDETKGETVSRTRILRNWSEEPVSTDGTLRCGRPKLAKNQLPTPEQKAIIDAVTCFQIIFGLVTFKDAVNSKGEAVTVTDYPVMMRVRGNNYRVMSDVIDALTKKRRDMIRTELGLSLKREKNGEVVYYVFVPAVDYASPHVWRGEDDLTLLKNFSAYVDNVNRKIMEDYTAAIMGRSAEEDATVTVDKVLTVDVKKSLEDDFGDDLPASMGGSGKKKGKASTVLDAG